VSDLPADPHALEGRHVSLVGDHAITAERSELKYLLPRAAYPKLRQVLDRHMTQHHFAGEDANRLPGAEHFVTTIYFDTPSRSQWRAAQSDLSHNVKVRAKEYYDEHPALAEIATTPDTLVAYRPWLWFELKRRVGERSEKLRFRVSKRDAGSVFEQLDAGSRLDSSSTSRPLIRGSGSGGDGERARIVEYCRSIGEPLSASCLVNYRRRAWQDALSTLRVTLDFDVAFYAVPADLWSRQRALARSRLGPARGSERSLVLEVKARGAVPAWLSEALTAAKARETAYSKFVKAGRAVHGDG
jgi:hypothetical protein